jgi:hypothetical protein
VPHAELESAGTAEVAIAGDDGDSRVLEISELLVRAIVGAVVDHHEVVDRLREERLDTAT